MMKNVIFFGILFSVICCCNGLYYLQQVIRGTCDVHVSTGTTRHETGMTKLVNMSIHGFFIKSYDYECNPNNDCKFVGTSLFRPDYAKPGWDTRVFFWGNFSHCEGEDYHTFDTDNPYIFFQEWFEKYEPATYRGIKCNKYYNSSTIYYSNIMYAFGDHTKDVVYGYVFKNRPPRQPSETFYEFSEEKHKPDYFKFDPEIQIDCNNESYTEPDQKMWENACSVVPK